MCGKETQMFHFCVAFLSGSYITFVTGLFMLKGGLCSSTGNGYHGFSEDWASAALPQASRNAPSTKRLSTPLGRRMVFPPLLLLAGRRFLEPKRGISAQP